MLGTNNETIIPVNGEQNTKGMRGSYFLPAVAFPWRRAVYGRQMRPSNKPSETNMLNMPRLVARNVLPRLKNYQSYGNRVNSATIKFPSGG